MVRKLQPQIDPATLGRSIAQKKKNMGLTLAEISDSTGVDKSQVSRFCSGKFKRPSRNLQKVCDFLQIKLAPSTTRAPYDLQDVISEVRLGWELAGAHREQFAEAIIALVKMVK